MLLSLSVSNLALIRKAEVEFGSGLNILTGETGAGKSLVIGSVNLALGARAAKDIVRNGESEADVELVFSIDSDEQREIFAGLGLPDADGDVLVLRRTIRDKRSIARINGQTVTAATLKAVAEVLIDIHGQHEHQSLLYRTNHRKILDEYAGEELKELLPELKEKYHRLGKIEEKLAAAPEDEKTRKRQADLLGYEIEEIENASLTDGEDEELEEAYSRMKNSQKIAEAVGNAAAAAGGESAAGLIGRAVAALREVSELDAPLKELLTQISEIEALLSDFGMDANEYLRSMEFSEEDFARTEERLDLINRLKSKYGDTIPGIRESLEERKKELAELNDYDAMRTRLSGEREQVLAELTDLCGKVSAKRKASAEKLAEKMLAALQDLNFNEVEFRIDVRPDPDKIHENGYDEVEFMISLNRGEEAKSLENVASGGELSRIMLALKTVLADKDRIDTLIFDEIDTGISGRTAQKVAEKLRVLSGGHQVICITHLPQIAAMADHHFMISKQSEEDTTITTVRELSEDETVDELSRLLSGAEITEAVRENAAEMKRMARQFTGNG